MTPLPDDPAISLGFKEPGTAIIQTVQAQHLIDVEIGESGSDTGYGTDSIASATTSLTSTATNHTFENGGRHHKFREGAYNFPNDDAEQGRENMLHAMIAYLCQQLHLAPIGPKLQNILDLGTGTGIWAMEMGDQYPSANVLGVDLSPIQPEWVPRTLSWPSLLQEALKRLKPVDWIELQEIHHYPQCHNGSIPPDHAIRRFWDLIIEGLAMLVVNYTQHLSLHT
ncbi:hypothetical protein B0O99DRAFT_686947 [Bisporella sp. PMI_857]|nr:hypothetical protein B0O99DRAFT_686947 [Bisporella sp. PMI_857]